MIMDITEDLDVIENSLRVLPARSVDDMEPGDQPINLGTPGKPLYLYRDPGEWWAQFAELSGYDLGYLRRKLAGIMIELRSGSPRNVADAAAYLLMFFDNPALYEHLDVVADHWETKVAGGIGQRWAKTICTAAWRVWLASEADNRPDSHFTLTAWDPDRLS